MSNTLELDKTIARDLAGCAGGEKYEGYTVLRNQMVETTRWSIVYELVIRDGTEPGNYWSTLYSRGATENQDEYPFEYDDAIFVRVRPVTETVVDYKVVK